MHTNKSESGYPFLDIEPHATSGKKSEKGTKKVKPVSKRKPESKHMPTFHFEPVDLLAPPTLLKIVFTARNLGEDTVDVVFIDKEGEPLSELAKRRIKNAGLPQTTRMPTAKQGHKILYGRYRALLAMPVKKSKKKFSEKDVRVLGGRVTRALLKEPFTHASIYFNFGSVAVLRAFMHGLQTPTYRFDDLKQNKSDPMTLSHVAILDNSVSAESAKSARDFVDDLVLAEHYSRKWIDMPAQTNCLSTTDVVRLVRKIHKRHHGVVDLEVIQGEALNQRGLNALWSVGKGRMPESPPALVVMRYMGAGEKTPTTALVGKCLVFDTGGEDMKPSGHFAGMKADMGGASKVLAAFDLVVRRQAKVNLVATLVIADNTVSATSRHPGSVLRTYRGKTIEDMNTDAEGRVVLADGIQYTEEHYRPDHLITLATLTGACVIALGCEFAGLFPKNDKISAVIEGASKRTWNKVWRLPLAEAEHTKVKPSYAADVTNLGERWGGAISAAKFLMEEFTETKHAAHLDVAGVAMESYDATGAKAKFSTGYGPALLWEVVHLLNKK